MKKVNNITTLTFRFMTKYFKLRCKKASIHFRMLPEPIDLPNPLLSISPQSTFHAALRSAARPPSSTHSGTLI